MTWLTDDKGCGKCGHCGMDMDMDPFCVDKPTLETAAKQLGRELPYGLNVNPARLICKGDQFVAREAR